MTNTADGSTAGDLRNVHEMLDRLGAGRGGSARERLFYLLKRRGWEPNVASPWGDDVVPCTAPPCPTRDRFDNAPMFGPSAPKAELGELFYESLRMASPGCRAVWQFAHETAAEARFRHMHAAVVELAKAVERGGAK